MARRDDWDYTYSSSDVEQLPWYYPKLDGDLGKEIRAMGLKRGKFLDIGTGPGTQAVNLAQMGFKVTATDISMMAVDKARKRAKKYHVKIKFLVDDILETKLKSNQFDFILDRGVFHTLEADERAKYVRNVRRILKRDGIYFMKCFSTKTPGHWGPYRFTKKQINEYFGGKFDIVSIRDSIFSGSLARKPKTLFCVMKPAS